jgi:hypothetical protein
MLHNYHRRDRSRAGFFPNLISLERLLSRADARCLPEKGYTVRPCGSGLFRINPPRLATLAHDQSLEPPSRCLREKVTWSAALEAPSTFKPPLERAPESRLRPVPVARSAGPSLMIEASNPTPLQPATSSTLTRRGVDGSATKKLERHSAPQPLQRLQRPRRFLRLEASVS